jgi:hypothetical protein
LTRENNNLAANNYTKSTGTLYLSDPALGLQVAKDAIFAGYLQVQGIGSSAYIQNNLRVDTQVYFQNTTLGLTNSGELISYGRISASGPSIGLAVANNTTIGGYLRVSSNSTITGATVLQNTLAVTGAATLSSTLAVTGATALSNTLSVVGDTTMANTLSVAGNITGSNNLTITNNTSTANLIVRNSGSVANSLSVGGTLSVTGSSYQSNITANSTVYTPILNATNYATVNGLTSNTIIRTTTSNISGTEYVDTIVANSSITTPSLTVSTNFSACNASLTANSITVGTGGLSVIGNFTINGTTIYNTPTFTLSALTPNQNSFLNVYRNPGANASIKWDNANVAWYVADVNTTANSYYYRVLSTQQLTDSVSTANSTLVASATAVKTAQDNMTTANTSMKSYVDNTVSTANTSLKSYTDNTITTANTSLKSYTDNTIVTANTSMKSYVDTANTSLKSYTDNTIVAANTSLKTYVDNSDSVLASRINAANTNASDASYLTTGTIPEARLPASGVSAGYWGGTTQIPVLNIDSTGRVTSAANVAVSSTLSTAGSSGTGSVSLINQSLTVTSACTSVVTVVAGSQTLTVTPQASGVGAGSYGSGTAIPVITVDTYGRVTGLSTSSVSTTITLGAGSGSGSVSGGGTLTISGGTGITTSVATGTFTITNSGVTGLTGTTNQVSVSASTGSVTLSLPQNVHTGTNFQVNSLGVGTGPTGTAGEIRATNNITAYYSDDRLKTRLGNIENALAKVMTLNGFQYEANETAQALGYTVKPEIGLSAQEVQAVLPEVVVPAPIDDKYLTIHYERVIPLLVEAIKELKQEIDSLKK